MTDRESGTRNSERGGEVTIEKEKVRKRERGSEEERNGTGGREKVELRNRESGIVNCGIANEVGK